MSLNSRRRHQADLHRPVPLGHCGEQRKIIHATRSAARLHLRELRGNGAVGVATYHCPKCEGWHVGHRMNAPRKRWAR